MTIAQTTSLEKIIVLDSLEVSTISWLRRIFVWIWRVLSELLHNDITAEEIKAHGNVDYFLRGPHSVYAEDAYRGSCDFWTGLPVLGISVTDATWQRIRSVEGRIVYNAWIGSAWKSMLLTRLQAFSKWG